MIAGFARKSVSWVAADTFGTAALSFIVMLMMARLLGPKDFGAAAIAISLIQVVNLFVEGLLHDALIQKRDIKPDDFDKAFWLVTGLGTAFATIALVTAFAFEGASFSQIVWLVFGMACSLPFSGSIGIGSARLRRDFRYGEISRASLVGRTLGSVVGIASAFAGAGAWSLIAQQGSSTVLYAVLLYRGMGWFPKRQTSFKSLNPLWSFALTQAVAHSLAGLRQQISLLVIASLSGLTTTGYMNFAFRLTNTPQLLLTTALHSLGFPLLAKSQSDRDELIATFQHFTKLIALFVSPLFLGLALCADDLVPVVLGAGWQPAVPAIQILACAAVLYFLRLSSSVLLRALGMMHYSLANSAMYLVVTVGALVLVRPETATWAAVCWVLPQALVMPITAWVIRREAGLSVLRQMRPFWTPLCYNIVMALAVLLAREEFAHASAALRLALSVVTGMVVYGCLLLVFERKAYQLPHFMPDRP